jgi:uncharacterized protein
MLLHSLSEGKLCVIDVSQMRGGQALVLSGLILRRIFDRNQQEFTSADPKTIPTIAVVEEAQSVLSETASASEPYIAWVKEGRKYDLGAVLITQQPGSIPVELLSQGDNWFIFHLLSSSDLVAVKRANAHFSDDLLSSLLNEPIPGQGVFWSSVGGKPYPVSLRVLSFEEMFSMRDPKYNAPAVHTHAAKLRATFEPMKAPVARPEPDKTGGSAPTQSALPSIADDEGVANIEARAIQALRDDAQLKGRIESSDGAAWGSIKAFLMDHLPKGLDNANDIAYHLVPKALTAIYGKQNEAWSTYRHPAKNTMYVRAGR